MFTHVLLSKIGLFARNFYLLNTASYGNCFVFNHKINTASDVFAGKRVTSQTGPSAGLTLVLDAETEKYMMNRKTMQVRVRMPSEQQITFLHLNFPLKSGARVVLSSTRVRPLPDEDGMDMLPNRLASAPIHAVRKIEQNPKMPTIELTALHKTVKNPVQVELH